MSLHAPTLEMTFADAAGKVHRMRAGTLPADEAWPALAAAGLQLRHALRNFGSLRQQRQAWVSQIAAAGGEPGQNAQAALARFDAEWWCTWRRAARLAAMLMPLQPGAAAAAPARAAAVQTLAAQFGERPDASLTRSIVQQLATQPGAMIVGAGLPGAPAMLDALFVTLALTAALLQRPVVTA